MSFSEADKPARRYWSLASVVLGFGVAGVVWWAAGEQFWATMAPRLADFGPGGLKRLLWQNDFSAFWAAGRLGRVGQGRLAYDSGFLLAYRQHLFSQAPGVRQWFYLPPALLPVMAVSYLPFAAAFWAWIVAQHALAAALLRWARLPWAVIVAGLLSPAALWSMQVGQFGVIMGALTVAMLMSADRAPLSAGLVLGCLVIKPQTGLLAGAAMLGRRRYWLVLGVAVGVAAALAGVVTVLAGWRVWPAYETVGLSVAKTVLQTAPDREGVYECYGVSVFWAMREWGCGLAAAYAVQFLCAAGSALLVWRLWRAGWAGVRERMAVTVCFSLLATPFGYTYDMVGYELALAACAGARGWRIDVVDALLFVAPAVCPVICFDTGWLLTPWAAAAAGGRVLWRATPACQRSKFFGCFRSKT